MNEIEKKLNIDQKDKNDKFYGYITSDLDKHINYFISGNDRNVVKAADEFIDDFLRYIP